MSSTQARQRRPRQHKQRQNAATRTLLLGEGGSERALSHGSKALLQASQPVASAGGCGCLG